MNVDLFAQKDWWWTPTGGLIKRKNSKPLSCRSYRRVLLKEKSLVLVYYRYKYQKKRFLHTTTSQGNKDKLLNNLVFSALFLLA